MSYLLIIMTKKTEIFTCFDLSIDLESSYDYIMTLKTNVFNERNPAQTKINVS